jgi:hypothetical protein
MTWLAHACVEGLVFSLVACVLLQVLQPLVDMDLGNVYFSDFHKLDIKGIPSYLTRTGYAPCSCCNPVSA